jgi:hypothetical protein
MPSESEKHRTIRVLVTSIDGRISHPFPPETTIGEVRKWAYEKIVQDRSAVALDATWIEVDGSRVDDAAKLSSLVPEPPHNPGSEVDLTVALSWTSQGGR